MLVNIAKAFSFTVFYILGFMQDCLLCVDEMYTGCHLQVFYINPD